MKTKMNYGGVKVGLNGSLPVQKIPGSKGVKTGLNAQVNVQKVAKGRVGGTSTAPKKANPGK